MVPYIPAKAKEILSDEIKIADKLYFSARMKQLKAGSGEESQLVVTENDLKTIIEYEKKIQECFKL